MKSSASASSHRPLVAAAVAIALGCTSSVDYLGYNRAAAGAAGAAGRVGAAGSGGAAGHAGAAGSGGAASAAGAIGTGGVAGAAGAIGTGGVAGAAGAIGTGGVAGSGGTTGSGGSVPTILGRLPCPSTYPNPYRDIGHSDEEIRKKLDDAFNQLFEGSSDNEAIYFPSGADQATIKDILHNDLRTEGFGIAMIALAMHDDREKFDRLWRYAIKNLEYTSGPAQGYYKSRCDNSASSTTTDARECIDPYGLQQFVMALLLARQRWVPARGMPDYGDEAKRLFDVMRNKEYYNRQNLGSAGASSQPTSSTAGGATSSIGGGINGSAGAASTAAAAGAVGLAGATSGIGGAGLASGGGTGAASSAVTATAGTSARVLVAGVTNVFDQDTKLVYYDPTTSAAAVTNTALEMPGYYEVWAQVTGDAFYSDAAKKARSYLVKVADTSTGLVPVRTTFDARAIDGWNSFTPEAYRVLINLVIDRLWGTTNKWQDRQIDNLLTFFLREGIDDYGSTYSTDGKTKISTNHPPELVLVNAVIASISNLSDADKKQFIADAWDIAVVTGQKRYYPGIIYLITNLILGGRFQLCP
jgi:endo-1,4-beta-D-glucanase Y